MLSHPNVQPHRLSQPLLSGPKDVTLLIVDAMLKSYPKGATASEKQRDLAVCSLSVCEREWLMNMCSLHWFSAADLYIQCFVNVVFVTYYLCSFFCYRKAHEKYFDTYVVSESEE